MNQPASRALHPCPTPDNGHPGRHLRRRPGWHLGRHRGWHLGRHRGWHLGRHRGWHLRWRPGLAPALAPGLAPGPAQPAPSGTLAVRHPEPGLAARPAFGDLLPVLGGLFLRWSPSPLLTLIR
ncbi:hypothetical protein [Micromonospora sp. CPCC 205556]|uniref:hypothetical protein n=1 Tax=Micromonospora sp. CPCC 205556 TaxID=3122398 RepID=UPI002FF2F784